MTIEGVIVLALVVLLGIVIEIKRPGPGGGG